MLDIDEDAGVADHQEADTASGQPMSVQALVSQSKQPQDAISTALRGGTPYPWSSSFSMQGKNFTIER